MSPDISPDTSADVHTFAGATTTTDMATKACPICWDTFTPPPRNPGKTYCSDRCRATANRRRRRDEPSPPAGPNSSPRAEDLPRPVAHRDCPHCGGPVTIVALLTTPEAARPATPVATPGGVIPLHR